jgi:type VI secretion system protein ImpD
LTDAGLVPIRRCRDTPYLVVNNLASAGRSDVSYTKDIATTNAQLSTMLNYVLCVSRFAHYVKVIARDWIGSFISPQECQTRLMTWLNGYCSIGDDLSFELRARYPLERASVQVSEIVGRPGSYECALLLKPHLQLDQAISEFQLVTVIQGVQRQL